MPEARLPRRIHIWQPLGLLDAGGGDGSFTVNAPAGYRVVSGGYKIDDMNGPHFEITASYPITGAGPDLPNDPDGWTFEWRETGTIDNASHLAMHVICERDDEYTVIVTRDDPNAV